ncbi:MAG: hypothetical protein OEW00_00935 [candidate division Zixibacteria bacterium]|nr:hypothetical protein [candidate division Zixibacteria bacterium]
MNKRVSSILVALALAGFVAGCSESPTAQYDAGKATLEKARLAEAEQYAPALFSQATDSLNAAVVEMQKQDDRFSAFRSYGKAKEFFIVAQGLAEKAVVEAAAEKERVRLQDSTLIAEIDSLITEANKSIAAAPKGKGSRIDLKVMQADITAASAALTAATGQFSQGRYLTAREQLQAVRQQVMKVTTDIQTAVSRLSNK